MQISSTLPPRWNLSNVYPSLDSPQLRQDVERVKELISALTAFIQQLPVDPLALETPDLAQHVDHCIDHINQIILLSRTIGAYFESFITTDSYNTQAIKMQSEFDQVNLLFQQQTTRFAIWVGKLAPRIPQITAQPGAAHDHAFFLKETAEQSRYLMSPEMEDLSSELSLSGAHAWSKLQGTVTSQLTVEFELDGKNTILPMPALVNLHSHEDEDVRRRAYDAEMKAWEGIKYTLAAAMNGIKGSVITLDRRRGRVDSLHSAIDASRIDRPTLEAMLAAMRASFPAFQRYFKSKAARLGKEKLPWWDLFAPIGETSAFFTYPEARQFILENFATFSPDLEAFARRAFDNQWIDAEQRPGKQGGGFCMSVPGVKESRILCNFDDSLDQVSTIAHELGHAFHNNCIFEAGKTEIQADTPMTLAETASILCETIIVDAALAHSRNQQEELAILETSLSSSSQVIVDIYSRYLFEMEVFARREKSDLSPDDLCEIMENAQKATYGDALDERYLHKFMWTWKPHYYLSGTSFYNFPYAFGQLFSTGLYAIYQKRGPEFVADYKHLLASTGDANAADLAASFGIDIRSRQFWEDSLNIITQRIDRYTQI